jgi:hypothetical protein
MLALTASALSATGLRGTSVPARDRRFITDGHISGLTEPAISADLRDLRWPS